MKFKKCALDTVASKPTVTTLNWRRNGMSEMVYVRIVGKLEEFDPKSDTTTAYIPGEKRAATFLSALGKNTFQVLRNLMLTEKVYEKSLDQMKVLLNHYEPKPLVISECFNFNRHNQEPNESIQDHVADLRRLTIHCEFGNILTMPYMTDSSVAYGVKACKRNYSSKRALPSLEQLRLYKAWSWLHRRQSCSKVQQPLSVQHQLTFRGKLTVATDAVAQTILLLTVHS